MTASSTFSSADLPTAPQSLWRAEKPAWYPPLATDLSCDVVVIGAGLTGLTTAVLLARRGVSVRVLESRTVGAGCTGYSSAKASILHGLKVADLAEVHGAETAKAYVDANQAGFAWLVEQAGKADCSLERRAAALWTEQDNRVADLEREAAALQAAGVIADVQEGVELDVAGKASLHVADQAQIDPQRYLAALAHEIDATPGCGVHEGSRVQAVSDRFQPGLGMLSSRPKVRTAEATLTCDRVVVATQIPFLDRAAWFARLTPHRSYVLACRTDRPAPRTMLLSVDSPTRSVRTAVGPGGEELVLVGGDGHQPGHGPDTREHVRNLAAWAQQVFGLQAVPYRWAAQDYTPLDGLPKVGPLWPAPTRVAVATGYDKWGLTNGTAAAMVLAGDIMGEPSEHAAVFAPHRLAVRRAVPSFVKGNADVAKEMTTGWADALTSSGPAAPADGEGVVTREKGLPCATSTVDGVTRSVSGVCTHLGGVLEWNAADRSWDCPLHGSRFGPDGEVLQGPATKDLSDR